MDFFRAIVTVIILVFTNIILPLIPDFFNDIDMTHVMPYIIFLNFIVILSFLLDNEIKRIVL